MQRCALHFKQPVVRQELLPTTKITYEFTRKVLKNINLNLDTGSHEPPTAHHCKCVRNV